jgi:hypothetical protein
MRGSLRIRLCTAVLYVVAGPALCGTDASVAGQKLDSGLGDLPRHSRWVDPTGRHPLGCRVVGESLDDGLSELPHFSKWMEPTGRDLLGRNGALWVAAKR